MEEWRAVPGWEGHYEVSSEGRVRSLDRTIPHGKGTMRKKRGVMLSPCRSAGYPQVNLLSAGRLRKAKIHILVCEAFHGPKPAGCEVLHKDGTRSNNKAENLRWGTRKENVADSIIHGTFARPKGSGKPKIMVGHANGERQHLSKLTERSVREIRRRRYAGESSKSIADDFGVNNRTVWAVLAGETWRHVV